MSAKDVESEALRLPLKERARLAEHLLGSLEDGAEADSEDLWLDEAERRYQAYRKGEVEATPAHEALRMPEANAPGKPGG